MTVSYSINGKDITYDKLKEIRITKKDYITTYNILEDWIREHIGDEIYY